MLVPLTVAVNCCVCGAVKLAVAGLTCTETGIRVTVEVADFVGSAVLVAVTVTVWVDEILLGAVYSPVLEIVPTEGLMAHVTAVLLVPLTVAVNCCVCEAVKLAVAGLTCTDTPLDTPTISIALICGSSADPVVN